MYYSSENTIYSLSDSDWQVKVVPSSHNQAVDLLAHNSSALYSSGFDKFLIRYENHKEVSKVTLPNKA